MRPIVLIYAPDVEDADLLRRTLAQVGLDSEIQPDSDALLAGFHQEHYDGAIVDCSSKSGDAGLLGAIRMTRTGATAILFALVDNRETMHEAYRSGATFCLDLPLQPERVHRCFRAAYGLILGERRRYYRHPYETPVRLRFADREHVIDAMMVNISCGGLCVRSNTPLPEHGEGRMEFLIDSSYELLTGSFVVAWRRSDAYGIQFRRLSRETRERLNQWLNRCAEQALGIAPPPGVVPKFEAGL